MEGSTTLAIFVLACEQAPRCKQREKMGKRSEPSADWGREPTSFPCPFRFLLASLAHFFAFTGYLCACFVSHNVLLLVKKKSDSTKCVSRRELTVFKLTKELLRKRRNTEIMMNI